MQTVGRTLPRQSAVQRQVSTAATAKTAITNFAKKVASTRIGGAGYRKSTKDALWLPNTTRPGWLDGSLPGDRGFDPLGLSKPGEFVQIGLDGQDQNLNKNPKGSVESVFAAAGDKVSETRLAPYSEVFGLSRFRECELIHGRWAMLATLGAIVGEASTGVSWVYAGQVEAAQASYAGLNLPFSITQVLWINTLAIGGAEIYRNTELNSEKRLYPGGIFDPLGLASGDAEKAFRLKEAEIKHGRLAMTAFLGYAIQALSTGEGATGSLAKFAKNLSNEVASLV